MMKLVRQLLPLLSLAACLAGCSLLDKAADPSDATGSGAVGELAGQPSDLPPPSGPGSIEVTVELDGTPPDPKPLDRSADSACNKAPANDPSLLVKAGRLQNAVVRMLDELPADPAPAENPKSLVIEQKDCMYQPRVAVLVGKRMIEVRNADTTMHTVHAYDTAGATLFNSAQPPRTPPVIQKLDGGPLVHLECDTHPWMHAWIAVSSHRFVGVTGAEGVVRLADVPAREEPYRLQVWHETLGEQQVEVRVEPGKAAQARVRYPVEALTR